MTLDSSKWDEDLPADSEEEYQTFLRTLERTEGFRLLFVRCTPAEGEYLIARVKDDLPKKNIEFLRLDKPIENLYEIVERLAKREQINILFVQGLEHSFYEYEQVKFGDTNERDFYSWKGVPRILNHLNQQRERFRDDFDICFVFLLRSFSLKYFIHRAPDFFDWRSSVFEFPTAPKLIEQESSRLLQEGDYDKYLSLTPEERIQKILEIQEILEEADKFTRNNQVEPKWYQLFKIIFILKKIFRRSNHKISYRSGLRCELGNLLDTAKEYEAALSAYDQALKITPNSHNVWNNRGNALIKIERIEEAIESYAQALQIKPNSHYTWNNRGTALIKIERIEEAIDNYDQALKIKPDKQEAWYGKACFYALQGDVKQAITNLQQAINLSPDEYREMANTDSDFDNIREDERFQTLIREAVSGD